MNSPLFFELQANDPERLQAFYKAAFHWTFEKQSALTQDYWRIETEGISGGLLKRPAQAPPERSGTNAAVISMEVDSYDKTEDVILGNGGVVALPKFAVPGKCWQGYYIDTDGNTFGIFQVDTSAT